jgi:hypothetical protein
MNYSHLRRPKWILCIDPLSRISLTIGQVFDDDSLVEIFMRNVRDFANNEVYYEAYE